MLPYEILFRWSDQGVFLGAHTIRRDKVTGQVQPAQPLGLDKDFPMPEVILGVNQSLSVENAQLTTNLSKVQKEVESLQKRTKEAEEGKKELLEALRVASQSELERKAEALRLQLSEIETFLNPAFSKDV